MAARTSWNPRYERSSEYFDDDSYANDPAYDDLLDHGFDDFGRLTRRRPRRQPRDDFDEIPEPRERMDLRRAIDSLARQVENIARQSGRVRAPAPVPASAHDKETAPRRNNATLEALDRLESRLDTLQSDARRRAAESESQEELERKLIEQSDAERARVEALMESHFAALDERIAALHDLAREKNVDTIRDELAALGTRLDGLTADGQSTFGTIDQVRQQVAELRQRLESDGWSGASTLSAMQDRLELIADKLAQLELTPSALSAVELGYSNILERVSRIEQLAGQSASADDLTSRLDGIREQIARLENRDGLGSLEYRIAALSDNIDALASRRGSDPAFDRVELKLADMARTIGIIRDRRDVHSGAIETRLADIAARIDKMAQDRGRVDFTPVERQIASLSSRIDKFGDDRQEIDLSGMERQLAELGSRIENMLNRPEPEPREEPDFSHIEARLAEVQSRLEDLFAVADRSDGSDAPSAALEDIDQRLAALHARLDELALTTGSDPADLSPISSRLDAIDSRLNDLAKDRSSASVPVELSILSSKLNLIDEQLRDLAPTNPDLPALFERLAQIDGRISEIASPHVDFSPLSDQIAALEQRLNSSDSVQGFDLQPLSGRLERIEARLDTMSAGDPAAADLLADRLDAIDRRFDELPQPVEVDISPLNERLVAIDEQLRGIGSSDAEGSVDLSPVTEQLQAIDRQLRGMSSSAGDGYLDLSPVTQRLDQLEERLANDSPGEIVDPAEIRSMLGALDERVASLAAMPLAAAGAMETAAPDYSQITDRLMRIDERISALNVQPASVDMSPVTERLHAIEQRLEAYQASESPVNENLMPLLETLEGALRKIASSNELSELAEKVSGLHSALDNAGDGSALDEMAELRNDITYLRRELRSMPMMAESEDGSGGLGSMLADIRERLDRVPVEQPVTFRDLEDQIGRIVRSIEAGGSNSGSLAHIEASLAAIEARLEDAGQAAVQAALANVSEGAGTDGVAAIAALAASIEGSIDELKNAKLMADEDTRRTLDALNSTMEILVDRMNDLESVAAQQKIGDGQTAADVEASFAGQDPQALAVGYDSADVPEIAIRAEEPEYEEVAETDFAELAERGVAAESPAFEPEPVTMAEEPEPHQFGDETAPVSTASEEDLQTAFDEPLAETSGVSEAAEAPAELGDAQSDKGHGVGAMLGRLTSSQILKRATGGRADSFTPASEDDSDQPDEVPAASNGENPPEHAPQDSVGSVLGEPAFDSGEEHGRTRQGGGLGDLAAASGLGFDSHRPDEQENQFLSAARRAARAAVLEAASVQPDPDAGKADDKRPRRRIGMALILLAAVVSATAFAGYKYWRGELDFRSIRLPSLGFSGFSVSDNVTADGEDWQVATGTEQLELPSEAADEQPDVELDAAIAGTDGLEQVSPNAEITFSGPETLPEASMQISKALTSVVNAVTEKLSVPAAMPTPDTDVTENLDTIETTASLADPARPQSVETKGAGEAMHEADRIALADPSADAAAVTEAPAASAAPPTSSEVLPASIGSVGLRQAALANIPEAQFEIASRFADGSSVARDMTAAAHWYERAAANGLAPAQYRLGSLYEKGRGVAVDKARAYRLYRQAARVGNAKAMHNLAVLYADGGDGEPDLVKAVEWFRKAADHGVRDSQFNIGILYSRGLGVEQDLTEAYKWFAIAAKSGDKQAAERRDTIANSLGQDTLAEALAAASIFQPIPLKPEANLVVEPKGGWAAAAAISSPSGPELISQVQALLAKQGFDPGPADGVMGSRTAGAIEAFQMEAGLPITGKADLTLLSALQSAVN